MRAAKLSTWGKNELRELKRIEAKLPSWAGPMLREIETAMTKGNPETRTLARFSRKLCEVLGSVSPKLDPKLVGRIVARLIDSLFYADVLSKNVREISRIGIDDRSMRERLRLALVEIHEGTLKAQRRQVEGLRRDIPLLLKQLKGDKC